MLTDPILSPHLAIGYLRDDPLLVWVLLAPLSLRLGKVGTRGNILSLTPLRPYSLPFPSPPPSLAPPPPARELDPLGLLHWDFTITA